MVESGLEKLKFYDTWFKVLGASIVLIFILFLLYGYLENEALFFLIIFSSIALFISIAVIFWGMVYHEYKREEWLWLGVTIIVAILFGAGFLVSIIYYFAIMRKEFKKGKGVYDEEITPKEKEKIDYYKKHKSEIDKKEDEDFMKFLKWIGIVLGVLILFFIISKFL